MKKKDELRKKGEQKKKDEAEEGRFQEEGKEGLSEERNQEMLRRFSSED